MYFCYVDESGDPGEFSKEKGNSKHFILTGIIIPANKWKEYLENIKKMRVSFKQQYGLSIREELHAAELIRIHKIDSYRKIKKSDRISMFKQFITGIPQALPTVKVINICIDKTTISLNGFESYAEIAWNRLIQRYDRYLKLDVNDIGIIITDDTDEPLVRKLTRKMRVFNPVPSKYKGSYQAITDNIVEDPFLRNSKHSYMIQVADAIAHSLYRKEYPKGSLKKYRIHELFDKLEPVLLKKASGSDDLGIVRG